MSAEIITDGTTVWVNKDGHCLGRFGVNGVDVHQPLPVQLANGQACAHCSQGLTSKKDWEEFISTMKRFHNVSVSDRYMPRRVRG